MGATVKFGGMELITFDYGYTISATKDYNRSDDSTVFSDKRTITVRGSIAADGDDPSVKYQDLLTAALDVADKGLTVSGRQKNTQTGILTISGPTGAVIQTFNNAVFVSSSSSEPPEDTAGIHFIEVSLVFEAIVSDAPYRLKSASETWDIKRLDQNTLESTDLIGSVYFNFEITHNITAEGMVDIENSKEAFEQAYQYVQNRKKGVDVSPVVNDIIGQAMYNSFSPKTWQVDSNASPYPSNLSSFNVFNTTRTSSSDIAKGAYSLTTVYTLVKNSDPVSLTLDAKINADESGGMTIAVDGTVEGLTNSDTTSPISDKFGNAQTYYDKISGSNKFGNGSSIFIFANSLMTYYDVFDKGLLWDKPTSVSVGHNRQVGSISFSVTYKVVPSEYKALLDLVGGLSAVITFTDTNPHDRNVQNQKVVLIPILGNKTKGPIIQDMSTTTERTRNVSIEVIVPQDKRTKTNDAVRKLITDEANTYAPTVPSGGKIYVQDFQETWDWINGKCATTIQWVYRI